MLKRIFLIIILIIGFLAFFYWGVFLPKDANSTQTKIFSVKSGEGTRDIAINLEAEGLIKSAPLFRIYTLTWGLSNKLQAGEYLLSSSMNVIEIADKMVLGQVIKEEITIIEGWNLRDIAQNFEQKGLFTTTELFMLVGYPLADDVPFPKDFSGEFAFLQDKPKNVSLEGYLFPDTYEIQRGKDLPYIISRILANFDKKLTPDLRAEIKRQNKTIFEVITMASLLEKEVMTMEDKKKVSGVLWKRLKIGMPLQVDATVSYVTGKKSADLLLRDLNIDSSYNTYKYRGLPLGPICNPGLESIEAAIYPKATAFWYYLSTPGGETIFSKTFKEHSLAKQKYLK